MPSWFQRVNALLAVAPGTAALARPALARPLVLSLVKVPAAEAQDSDAQAIAQQGSQRDRPDQQTVEQQDQPTPPDDLAPRFFAFLLQAEIYVDDQNSVTTQEQGWLDRLDAAVADTASHAELLPRASAVIPQLLNSLRDEGQSAQSLATRVARDPNLVAEVIRSANSTYARVGEPVSNLAQAIVRIGTAGLQRAIAKVVLKPIFSTSADSLSARAAPRLWQHTEAQADACARLCSAARLDSFEGYLAGLLHDTGWTAALRLMDRQLVSVALPTEFSAAFVSAFALRRERLFAALARCWQLSESLSALAQDWPQINSALAQALCEADRQAALDLIGATAG